MAAVDLDFLTRVVNVHWGGGLAIEFTGRPSYLTLATDVLNMNKVTISFWFRIPEEVAREVGNRNPEGGNFGFGVMNKMVPLLIFGQQQMAQIYDLESVKVGELPFEGGDVYGTIVTGSHLEPMQPSCIGVRYFGDLFGNPDGELMVHIQTSDKPTGANLFSVVTGVDENFDLIVADATYVAVATPERLGNFDRGGLSVPQRPEVPTVKAGEWHHMLISWDLSRGSAAHGSDDESTIAANTSAFSLMWCALDDINRNKEALPALWVEGGNANGHISTAAYTVAAQMTGDASKSISASFSAIPSNPLSLPAPATLMTSTGGSGETGTVVANQMIEMAELQIFTGVTLDTSVESNRRAFIDLKEDAENMTPVDPAKAETLLGKKPDVLLHGTIKWQDGNNTGSLGIDTEGEPIPSGQFTPTGVINKYPDPVLGE